MPPCATALASIRSACPMPVTRTVSLGTGLSCLADRHAAGRIASEVVRGCPSYTAPHFPVGHATGTLVGARHTPLAVYLSVLTVWRFLLSPRGEDVALPSITRSRLIELRSSKSGSAFLMLSCQVLWILPPVGSKNYFGRVIREPVGASFSNSSQEPKLFLF
jgi:hypothetical protein